MSDEFPTQARSSHDMTISTQTDRTLSFSVAERFFDLDGHGRQVMWTVPA